MDMSVHLFISPAALCAFVFRAGWLVDETSDYSAAFYLSGLCPILSGVFVVLVDHLIQRRKAAEAEDRQAIRQEDWEGGKVK